MVLWNFNAISRGLLQLAPSGPRLAASSSLTWCAQIPAPISVSLMCSSDAITCRSALTTSPAPRPARLMWLWPRPRLERCATGGKPATYARYRRRLRTPVQTAPSTSSLTMSVNVSLIVQGRSALNGWQMIATIQTIMHCKPLPLNKVLLHISQMSYRLRLVWISYIIAGNVRCYIVCKITKTL